MRRFFVYAIDVVLKELPLFLSTFFFLNPIWIGMIKNAPFEALKTPVFVDNIISCDFYTTLLCSYVISFTIGLLPQIAKILIKIIIYIILVSIFVIKKFLFNEVQMGFTADVLTLVLQTTPSESSGFVETYLLNPKGLKYGIMFLSCVVVSGLAEYVYWKRIRQKAKLLSKSIRNLVAIFLVLAIAMGCVSNSKYFELECYPECNSFTSLNLSVKRLMETRQYSISFWSVMKTIKTENDVADCSEDSINVVFVLGESFAKAHSSLYGYPLPTTPYSVEEKENGNLYLFEDLISPIA